MRFVILIIALAVFASAAAYAAAPVVSSVTARQRTDGSKMVDIYYNLSDSDTANLLVSMQVSSDGGGTWTANAAHLSGDVGSYVPRGTRKHIVWDAGADLPGVYGTNYKVSIIASDFRYTGQMIYIPAGSFLMGNNRPGQSAPSNELPQHSVYLSGYYIGEHEVTRGEYRQFINAGGYSNPAYWSTNGWSWKVSYNKTQPDFWDTMQYWVTDTFTQTDIHPVVGVTYYEAEAFCNWAGGRLPTEAEWEKAASWTGSYPNVYPWGNTWDAEKCNNYYDHNAAGGGYARHQTAAVGSYPSGASPYGCQDMSGNVLEWCQDWYGSNYYSQTPTGGWHNPTGPESGNYRVLRGGSWISYYYDYHYFCCSQRYNGSPSIILADRGFRLVR